jgi:hypothetical protein
MYVALPFPRPHFHSCIPPPQGPSHNGGGRRRGGQRSDGHDAGEQAAQSLPQLSEESLQRLMEMGFERDQAMRALQMAHNDVDAAIGLLVS